jgi:hypothetical protein
MCVAPEHGNEYRGVSETSEVAMSQLTPKDTATRIREMFRISEQLFGRLTKRTLRKVSRRRIIRESFLRELQCELEEQGVLFVQYQAGRYGLAAASSFEESGAVTVKKHARKRLFS